jgi:uncharacterized protein (TIGR04222 family)
MFGLSADVLERNASFLFACYVGAFGLLALVAFGIRRAVARIVLSRPGPPTPSELGILHSRDRAVHSGLAALRAAGAIGPGQGRRLATTGAAPEDLDPLCRAVHDAIGRRTSTKALLADRKVVKALKEVETSARLAGWLVPARVRRLARFAGFLSFILSLAGLVGYVLDPRYALLALPPLLLLIAFAVVRRTSRAGRQQREATRQSTIHLHPHHSPSWATYGPAGAAVGVALYGPGALWAADPDFARVARLPHPSVRRLPRSGDQARRGQEGWPGYSDYHGDYHSGGWQGVPDSEELSGGYQFADYRDDGASAR